LLHGEAMLLPMCLMFFVVFCACVLGGDNSKPFGDKPVHCRGSDRWLLLNGSGIAVIWTNVSKIKVILFSFELLQILILMHFYVYYQHLVFADFIYQTVTIIFMSLFSLFGCFVPLILWSAFKFVAISLVWNKSKGISKRLRLFEGKKLVCKNSNQMCFFFFA